AGGDRRVIAHEQRFCVGRLVVDRDTHIAERADNAVDGFCVDQIVGQVIVDFAVREIAALFTELDQDLEAIAARFLFFGRHLVAYGRIFFAFATLATALGQWLQIGDDFSFNEIVVVEIGGIVVGIFGRAARTTA